MKRSSTRCLHDSRSTRDRAARSESAAGRSPGSGRVIGVPHRRPGRFANRAAPSRPALGRNRWRRRSSRAPPTRTGRSRARRRSRASVRKQRLRAAAAAVGRLDPEVLEPQSAAAQEGREVVEKQRKSGRRRAVPARSALRRPAAARTARRGGRPRSRRRGATGARIRPAPGSSRSTAPTSASRGRANREPGCRSRGSAGGPRDRGAPSWQPQAQDRDVALDPVEYRHPGQEPPPREAEALEQGQRRGVVGEDEPEQRPDGEPRSGADGVPRSALATPCRCAPRVDVDADLDGAARTPDARRTSAATASRRSAPRPCRWPPRAGAGRGRTPGTSPRGPRRSRVRCPPSPSGRESTRCRWQQYGAGRRQARGGRARVAKMRQICCTKCSKPHGSLFRTGAVR